MMAQPDGADGIPAPDCAAPIRPVVHLRAGRSDKHEALWAEFNNIDIDGYAREHPQLFAYVKKAMAQPSKQFLLIGDTNHSNGDIEEIQEQPCPRRACSAMPPCRMSASKPTARTGGAGKAAGLSRLPRCLRRRKAALLPEEATNKAETGFWKDIDQHNFWREFGMGLRGTDRQIRRRFPADQEKTRRTGQRHPGQTWAHHRRKRRAKSCDQVVDRYA